MDTTRYNKVISPCKTLCLLIMLFMAEISFSQPEKTRIDSQKLYETELEKHLFPRIDTLNTKQVVLFLVIPEVEPNSSLRIIDIGKESYLEVRYLDKNVWYELLTSLVEHRYKPMSLNTHFLSVPISKCFRNKMLATFCKVIVLHKNRRIQEKLQIFDGTSYDFRANDNGKITSASINSDLDSYDFRYQVAMTNLKIINDLKNNSFNESKYQIYYEEL